MRWLFTPLLLALFITGASAHAAPGKVLKVLPQYLDLQGRASLSPSLYDRDAYQAQLRAHPDQRSGLVFHVRWKAGDAGKRPLTVRVEARGVVRDKTASTVTLNQTLSQAGWLSQWTQFTVTGEQFKQLDTLTAWRATLWEGDNILSEYKSFLW